MNDYYLLIGLNRKEVKITNISQYDNGIVEVSIESKKKKALNQSKVHNYVQLDD